MEKQNLKREIVFWIMLIIPFCYIAYSWSALPQRVPVHFDMGQQADQWGNKQDVFILPMLNVFLYFLFLSIRRIDPKRMDSEFFRNNFYRLRLVQVVFFSIITLVLVYNAAHSITGDRWIRALTFMMMAVMGNFMINCKPNWFMGFRTPWTLSSEFVWKRTHQIGGKIFFFGGLIGFALTFILPTLYSAYMAIALGISSAVFCFIYSFIMYKKEEKQLLKTGGSKG